MIIEHGILRIFADNLNNNCDAGIIKTIVEAMSHILRHGKKQGQPNEFQAQFEVNGILDRLEDLQLHPNRQAYEAVIGLIEMYFEVRDPI